MAMQAGTMQTDTGTGTGTGTDTPLDLAHGAMERADGDDDARLRFYDRLADAELFVLLTREASGGQLDPEIFETAEGRFLLAFDREARLTEFTGRSAPYAAVSGRAVAAMLAGQGLGLALNPGVAPSSILLPAEAMDWLADTLSGEPEAVEHRARELTAPGQLPERLLGALDTKLAAAGGLARSAYLAGVVYEGGARSHLLAFIDTVAGAEPALARACREALVFSGLEAGEIDVVFLAANAPLAARLARVGLRFDLPQHAPDAGHKPAPKGPGMDPDKPPRLR